MRKRDVGHPDVGLPRVVRVSALHGLVADQDEQLAVARHGGARTRHHGHSADDEGRHRSRGGEPSC
ncbi:hypothetical protein [Nonomuraea dietziae]|uniref:hypothetical protein n=1 Tax=Nonomuraea dietziae TaxID=65515 RepID=UPI0031E3786A